MISVGPLGQPSSVEKKVDIAVFLDIINVMNIKLFVVVVLVKVYT